LCISLTWGWERARSCRLRDLIPICQQRRNLLKLVITARRGNVRIASGSIHGCVPPSRFGLPAAKPSRGIGWHGRIASTPAPNNAACAAKSAKSSQLCGDANYSRVHAEGEPPLHTTALPTLYSLPFSVANTKGWNGIMGIWSRSRGYAVPTNDQGTSLSTRF